MQKRGFLCILVLTLAVIFGGCSSGYEKSASSENTGSAKVADQAVTANSSDAIKRDESNSHTAKSESGTEEAKSSKSGAPGFTAVQGNAESGKKLIYKADLSMQVKDYRKAQDEVRSKVKQAGGYIVTFSEDQSEKQMNGRLVIKVPAAGFSSFMDDITKIKHESLSQSMEGQDVTEEYVDLESRLKAKQIMEERYTEFMKKAAKTDDLVTFANELGQIQEEIEQVKGRMRYLDNNVTYSTVSVHLFQSDGAAAIPDSGKEHTPLLERAKTALSDTLNVMYLLVQWLLVVLSGALPVLLLGCIIGVAVWKVRAARAQRRAAKRESFRHNPASAGQDQDEKASEKIEAAESLEPEDRNTGEAAEDKEVQMPVNQEQDHRVKE
ncbi:DUF4349 domain-containing protein [Paenibacillus tuaregi]|uniref:DUF4349 domain-containing protein n=1 Tax=Paenibacillus tuaregi TaxID=1816681 RepID=UPI0008383C17|nr:DUF4349 domain-containing protein [Paenibacillus tuaregi]